MEGLHAVGDILTKISANLGDKFTCCIVIYVLIIMGLSYVCLYLSVNLWVFIVYVACICLLSF
jgi:hypothetical protein